jgi:hypothetical protein
MLRRVVKEPFVELHSVILVRRSGQPQRDLSDVLGTYGCITPTYHMISYSTDSQ